jgi:TolB-like protein
MDQPAPPSKSRPTGTGSVRFGTFDVDLSAGELRKGGVKIKLYGQPFNVLAILLERPGDVVTREELQQKLWAGGTFVDFEHGLNKAINKVREALGDDADNPRFIETLPRRGYRFISQLESVSAGPVRPSKTETPSPGKQPRAIDSLAVLPLENASGDPEIEYLSDGIAETLINSLAQLRKIRVVPRTLSFQYRVGGVESLRAGRELGVQAVLAGRLLQRGDDLIVSVELVDVDRQAQLWGGRYSRKMTDLVALQEELTIEISEKLRLQLTGNERKRIRKRQTENNEAFRLVLQAQHYINWLSPEGLRKGIALCQQAIAIDPNYVEAYGRTSFGYAMLGFLGFEHRAEVHPRLMAAAKKALELDETLADGHIGLGWGLFLGWDLRGGEREARRSVTLNPDSTEGFALLNQILVALGSFDEAIAAGQRAVALAPLDYYSAFVLSTAYYHAQQFDKAIEQSRKAVDIDPASALAHLLLAQSYAAAGKPKESIEECELALALNRPSVWLLQAAVAYARVGQAEEARKLAEEVEKDWKPDGVSAFWLACAHACLGDKDVAFEWLERAFQEHAGFLVWLKVFWDLECLRGDPRFDDLVKRIGIPD